MGQLLFFFCDNKAENDPESNFIWYVEETILGQEFSKAVLLTEAIIKKGLDKNSKRCIRHLYLPRCFSIQPYLLADPSDTRCLHKFSEWFLPTKVLITKTYFEILKGGVKKREGKTKPHSLNKYMKPQDFLCWNWHVLVWENTLR